MFGNNKRLSFTYVSTLIIFFALLFGLNFSVEAQTAKSVDYLVESLSGGKLRVETKATPYKLVGDFNGDKIKDIAVVVSLSDTVENAGKVVKIENPYARAWGKTINPELLGLFVIHGKGKGWQSAQKSSVLLLGRNSALIFQKERLNEIGDGMKIENTRAGKTNIVFQTEASEGILKWNGKQYTWTETEP